MFVIIIIVDRFRLYNTRAAQFIMYDSVVYNVATRLTNCKQYNTKIPVRLNENDKDYKSVLTHFKGELMFNVHEDTPFVVINA